LTLGGLVSAAPSISRLVSMSEAAEHLGICERTMRRYVAEGRVRAFKLGPKIVRFDVNDLDDLLTPIPNGRAG